MDMIPSQILFGLFVLYGLNISRAYEIIPNLKFSQMVELLPAGQHFENLTVHHSFYQEIGDQTLPEYKFKQFIGQDDIYVEVFFEALRILAEREKDPERKSYLSELGSQNWTSFFEPYYQKLNFTKPKQFYPGTLAYSSFQYTAAKYNHIGVALATLYPCHTVWAKMGTRLMEIADLKSNPNHKYHEFVSSNGGGMESEVVQKFINFTNGYYDRLADNNAKRHMLDAYIKAVIFELEFANDNYYHVEKTGYQEPSTTFTNLFEIMNPKMQKEIIAHSLWEEIAQGTLPFSKFIKLIEQGKIVLDIYSKAFELMEAKEGNLERKAILSNEAHNKTIEPWFQTQMFHFYGFGPSLVQEFYTEGYTSLIINSAKWGTNLESLALAYQANILWKKIGQRMSEIASLDQNPGHIYKTFILALTSDSSSSLSSKQTLLNEYYAEAHGDWELQQRANEVVTAGIFHQLQFINGIYGYY